MDTLCEISRATTTNHQPPIRRSDKCKMVIAKGGGGGETAEIQGVYIIRDGAAIGDGNLGVWHRVNFEWNPRAPKTRAPV